MNPQDPFAALHPLREPIVIGWWPLAPGWWLLACVVLLALAALVVYLVKHHRANAYRRVAIMRLGDIRARVNNLPADPAERLAAVSETNALLKAVALRVFPRHDVAALSGPGWLAFLNATRQSSSPGTEFPQHFASAAYQPQLADLDVGQLLAAAQHWISRHRGPA